MKVDVFGVIVVVDVDVGCVVMDGNFGVVYCM